MADQPAAVQCAAAGSSLLLCGCPGGVVVRAVTVAVAQPMHRMQTVSQEPSLRQQLRYRSLWSAQWLACCVISRYRLGHRARTAMLAGLQALRQDECSCAGQLEMSSIACLAGAGPI